MTREWLFRPTCPLCGLEDHTGNSGRKECFGNSMSYAEKAAASLDMCWWCLSRCSRWMERSRHIDHHQPITALHVAEFTAHVIRTKPKWLGDCEAFHPHRPISEEEKKRRAKTKADNVARHRRAYASALMSIPHQYRKQHWHLDKSHKHNEGDFGQVELDNLREVPGIVICNDRGCGPNGERCAGDRGRCVYSEPLS